MRLAGLNVAADRWPLAGHCRGDPFASFLVRLPMQDNPLIVEGEYHVRTILVAEGRPDGDEDDRRIYL